MRQHPGWVRLLQIHWQVQAFTHLTLHEEYMLSTHGRLSGVWSKLLAMTLVMYNKILLLDTDLLVRSGHDLEELWEYPAPAGIMRGTNDSYTGTRRPRTTYFREGKLIGGINGGVILLEPDQEGSRRGRVGVASGSRRRSSTLVEAGAEADLEMTLK